MSNIIEETLFEQIFGHSLIKLVDKQMQQIKKKIK